MDIRKTGLVVAILVMISLAVIIAPTFADTAPGKAGDSPGTLRTVPGKADVFTAKISFEAKRIRDYKVTDLGDISWCDIRIIHDNLSTPQIDSVTLTTNDPKISNALMTAYLTGHWISAKAHKITTPAGREWPGENTEFYEIDEITIINISGQL